MHFLAKFEMVFGRLQMKNRWHNKAGAVYKLGRFASPSLTLTYSLS